MNYINIIEGFWRMNAYDRFSSSEIILYLYLVHIGNQNYWNMPIACKTATLQSELGLNKSTIIRARTKLRKRGLIDFTEGVQNSCSPKYRLLDIHSCKNATASATAHATDSATADETINKDIDRDKYNYSFAHQKKTEVMELINKKTRINAEALMSALQHRKGTMPRFNFPLSEEDAFVSLISAIQIEVEFRRREFVATEELKAQVRRLSTFLTQENCKFGIVLAGGCGNGKTTIIKALQSLVNVLHIPNPYSDKEYAMRIIDAKSMVATCKSNYEDWKRLMYQDLLAIDDLGTEPREVMDYGNIINPTVDILTRRYENQLFTIISTNLTPPQISQVYGERIADRMREMMEIIPFTNASYRVLK